MATKRTKPVPATATNQPEPSSHSQDASAAGPSTQAEPDPATIQAAVPATTEGQGKIPVKRRHSQDKLPPEMSARNLTSADDTDDSNTPTDAPSSYVKALPSAEGQGKIPVKRRHSQDKLPPEMSYTWFMVLALVGVCISVLVGVCLSVVVVYLVPVDNERVLGPSTQAEPVPATVTTQPEPSLHSQDGPATDAVTIMAMKEPVCLIESDSEGKLRMVPSAQKILQQIEQNVVVVSVVGMYRTGKSYLMNKVAGRNKGFPLGSTIQSKTKRIWMWCVPHPSMTNHTLVLLDTEGLGNIEKGDTTNDNWFFAMAVLLSSTLVHNSMGTIDNKALENLHYVTELTKHIKMKSNVDEDDDRTYVRFLPSFVWAVRDFSLELELEGKAITADEYLEHSLKDKQGKGNQRYNESRAFLRKFFVPRACFVFERPANPRKMKRMEELTDADLDPDFVAQVKKFTEHIYTKSETKTFRDGIKVTGRLLGQLAETYLKAIRSGEVPCLENAVKVLAEIENPKAVEQAQVLYVQRMKSVRFPTNTLEELSAIHASSEREALALFMKHSFEDDDGQYQIKLLSVLQEEYNQICEKNVNESRKACELIIKQVFKPLEDNLGAGLYSVPGGYKTFCEDLQAMTDEYRRAEGRGVKGEEVLKTYLDEKAVIGKELLSAAEQHLSDAQRSAEEEKAKLEESERETRAMEEHEMAIRRKAADRQKTQEEAINQLIEKMEREKIQFKADFEKLMSDLNKQKERADETEKLWLEEQEEALKTEKKLKEEKSKAWYKHAVDTITAFFRDNWW